MTKPTTRLSLQEALRAARETRALEIGEGILRLTPDVFRQQFGETKAVIVADENTWNAAGREVQRAFDDAGQPTMPPFLFQDPGLYAEHRFIEQLQSSFAQHRAILRHSGRNAI